MWDLGVSYARWEGITFLVCMCLFCVVLVVLFGAGHLTGSWSLIAQGYKLDLLCDVTSIVSSCQLSGCLCYPMIHLLKMFMLHVALWDIQGVYLMHFVSFLSM